MPLIEEEQLAQLFKNGKNNDGYHPPVVRLFLSNTSCTWLISEMYANRPGIAFGLCDLGFGFPELGYCDLFEMEDAEDPAAGIKLTRDEEFKGEYPMSAYQSAARETRRIITDPEFVGQFHSKLKPQ